MSQYAKARGYQVEVQVLKALKPLFPGLRRTGSPAYKKSAADLVLGDPGVKPVPMVVTRDKSQELLVTLSMRDFLCMSLGARPSAVAVQVKARQKTFVGTLYRQLKEATR